MPRRASAGIVVAVVVALLAVISDAGPVRADGMPDAPAGVVAALDRLAARAAASPRGTVRVMVAFAPDAAGAAADTGAVGVDVVASIAAARRRVERALAGRGASVRRRSTSIASLAVEADADGLAALRAAPGVTSVTEDVADPPALAQTIPLIGAEQAHADGVTGAGAAVAILDTGVDAAHSFLGGRVVAQACFSAEASCPNGQTSMVGGNAGTPCTFDAGGHCDHGTHVAGIAAGNGGVAPAASIVSVQVFSMFTGPDCGGNPSPCALSYGSDQVAALDWITSVQGLYNVAAVNMSLGSGENPDPCDDQRPATKAAFDNLRAIGVAPVVAAANDGFVGAIGAPACLSSAIAVSSTTDADAVSSFSNVSSLVKLFAPGSSVVSSVPGGGFASKSGTSMAAPHVTGAFALLRQAYPDETVEVALERLASTGLPVADQRPGGTITRPRIRVAQAVALDLPAPAGRFTGVVPSRVLDSRSGIGLPQGKWLPGETRSFTATGVGGVPGAATAVVLNVTVTGASALSHITVFPAGTGVPTASSVNFAAGQTVANLVVVRVGTNDGVAIRNNSGTVDVIADVVGYYSSSGDGFEGVVPARILDSRDGIGTAPDPWGAGETRSLVVRGVGGVPAAATAVVLNVTASAPSLGSHLTVYPNGAALPDSSNVNFPALRTVPNLVVVKIGTDDRVAIRNNTGSVDVIADVVGFYAPTGDDVFSVRPTRILDSRDGLGTPVGPWTPTQDRAVTVVDVGGVPAGATAVVLNVTITLPSADTHLTVYPAGASTPEASSLNVVAGQTAANLVMVPVGTNGRIRIRNNAGDAHVIADVVGYSVGP